MLLLWVLGQDPPVDSSVYERLGTAGAVAAVLGAWIWWLIKDRARIVADRDAERVKNGELNRQLWEQALRLEPVAIHLGTVTEEASSAVLTVLADLRGRPTQ